MPEKRFQELRKALKSTEFDSVEFLKQKANELKDDDPKLSERILVRVRKLKKQENEKLSSDSTQPGSKEQDHQIVKPSDLDAPPHIPIIKASNSDGSNTQSIKPSEETVVLPASFVGRLKNLRPSSFLSISPFIAFVLIPTFMFSFYQLFWATERFESQAQIIVQQPDSMATMDASMALLTGMGGGAGGSDTELVKAYIYSNDMVQYLNEEIDLRSHYSQSHIDYFSRIHADDTREELFSYYQDKINVIINEKSGVVAIYCQGFDSEYAKQLTEKIVERAEWFINSIGHQLATAQLDFMKNEHTHAEHQLKDAQTKLLNFQQRYNLLDPTAEGLAMQQVTYTLEGQIAVKQTELKTLNAIMSSKAPQVVALKNELLALQAQLKTERNKLAQSGVDDIPVSELLAKFTDYKVNMELALQAYTSSQISLEKSRIEAYRQVKYLIVVEKATLSEDNKYPETQYNILLFLLIISMTYFIVRIIRSIILELK